MAGALTCDPCGTINAPSARFCKHCGSALVPPPQCPSCQATVTDDARFCASCGAKLVGARPGRADVSAKPIDRPSSPAATPSPARSGPVLPNRKKPSSNILANVLMFVAALAVFVCVMYAVNKDAPKSTSPFQGPPASGQMQQRMTEQPNATAAAVQQAEGAHAGASIKGTIKVDPSLTVPSGGTLFISARMAGMPAAGPPVAAKRIDSPHFPVEFEIGPENVMMGMPFNGPFNLSVKLSQSGNALAPQPGDLTLSAPKGPVKPGDTNVEIVLDKRL